MQERVKSGFLYDLFISYTRRNTKDWWASWWLYNKLSRFIIPKKYRWENADGKPVKRLRIFRDARANSGGELNKTIRGKIEHSESLVLIASRTASESEWKWEWVNEEVTDFVETRRSEPEKDAGNMKIAKNAIYPVVVSGGIEDSSFPSAYNAIRHERNDLVMLMEKPSLDSDFQHRRRMIKRDHQYGKKHCFYMILSGATGIESPELERRVFWQNVRTALAFIATVLLVLLLIWLYKKPRYEYYADWNDCFGSPKGVWSLTEEQLRHREISYQFEYRRIPLGEPGALRWRLVRVTCVRSTKMMMEGLEQAVVELQYAHSNGALMGKAIRNSNGKVISRSFLSDENERKAVYEDFQNTIEGQGVAFAEVFSEEGYGFYSKGADKLAKTTVSRHVYERDLNGFILKRTYHANNDYRLDKSAVCDEAGVWAVAYLRDNNGNALETCYLGREGALVANRDGVAKVVCSFDEKGLQKSESFFDDDSQPVGFPGHKKVITRDEYGNVIESSTYTVDGLPCINEYGYCKDLRTYDGNGFHESTSYYDESGTPCANNSWFEMTRFEKDSDGRSFSMSLYLTDGQPVEDTKGYHRIEKEYNLKCQDVETRVYDMLGGFVLGYRNEYDGQGNLTLLYAIDQDGNLEVNRKWGAAAILNEYDSKGNITGQKFMDASLRCIRQTLWEYDGRGNKIKEMYLDKDGNPLIYTDNEGYFSSTIIDYDDYGHIIRQSFYDVKNGPIAPPGVFTIEWEWDDYGNNTEIAYYDLNHQRTLSRGGFSFARRRFDSHRNLLEEYYYDVDGNKILIPKGSMAIRLY